MEFPAEFRAAIDALPRALIGGGVQAASMNLQRRYRRANGGYTRALALSDADVDAYVVYRLPATFAAVRAALLEVQALRPKWHPRTILDVGAGPGTAGWAAVSVWPEIRAVTSFEVDHTMRRVGETLAGYSTHSAIRDGMWIGDDIRSLGETNSADLVIASYALGEITPSDRETVTKKLWSLADDTLAVIEPGTPRGFTVVLSVRDSLIRAGGSITAPCPHAAACPMANENWCHFSQRLPRSRAHRDAKQGDRGYEDEKYSYVAVSRFIASSIEARIVRHPQFRHGHVRLALCTADGLVDTIVSKREGVEYRAARDAQWGQAFRHRRSSDKHTEAPKGPLPG